MKKILKNVLIGICILSMTMGCQGDNSTVKKVAVVQYMEHTSLNTIKDAFDKQMEELGYQDNQNIEYILKMHRGIIVLLLVLHKHLHQKSRCRCCDSNSCCSVSCIAFFNNTCCFCCSE